MNYYVTFYSSDPSGIPNGWPKRMELESFDPGNEVIKTGEEVQAIVDSLALQKEIWNTLQSKFLSNNKAAYDTIGNLKTVTEKTTLSSVFFISHNLCDKCSWYQESENVTDETLTWNPVSEKYESIHTFWIDLKHGRFTSEDKITGVANYYPTITVDDVEKIEDTDYTVNYESGSISPITWDGSDNDVVVATSYFYATSSSYTFYVSAGKKVKIEDTEVQRSVNIPMDEHIVDFDVYVGATMVARRSYKCYKDYLNVSNRSYPIVPASGELTQDVQILRWDYPGAIFLKDETYSIRCSIRGDQPFTGEMFTVTCYGVSENV